MPANDSVDRKPIKDALFGRLSGVTFATAIGGATTWLTMSRRLRLWNKVDPSAQPAMFLVQHKETYEVHGPGDRQRRILEMGAWCYAATGNPDSDSSIVGDDLLDVMEAAIEAVMVPDSPTRGENTLGGLVEWCRIDQMGGLSIRDPGDIDGQALLIMPIRILLP